MVGKWWLPHAWLVPIAACAFDCTGGGGTQSNPEAVATVRQDLSTVTTVVLTVPHPLSVIAPVLEASNSISIGANANVASGAIVAMGSGGVTTQPGATLNDLWSVGPVSVADRVDIRGTLYATNVQRGNSDVINKTNTSPPISPAATLSWTVSYPSGIANNFTVNSGQSLTLSPGLYGSLTVKSGANLNLVAGTYYLAGLTLNSAGTINLNQVNGPVIIYASSNLILNGSLASATGGIPDLLFVYLGSNEINLNSAFSGAIVAPSASLSFNDGTYAGFFAAQNITVQGNAQLSYLAPLAVASATLTAGATGGLQACADLIRPRDDLSGTAQAATYQADIVRYCTGLGVSQCLATLHGRANADYTAAALQALSQAFSPVQYIALSRDRTRKLGEAIDSATTATEFCTQPDSDSDWIPDADDKCPNTPPLTPTDDNGCPTAIPTGGPDPTQLQKLLNQQGFMMNPLCNGATPPPEVAGAALAQVGDAANGAFIIAERVTSQPTGCPIWYLFQIREIAPSGVPTGVIFDVAFKDTEQTPQPSPVAGIAGLPSIPLTSPVVQFNAKPTDPGTRGQLGSIPASPNRASFRVQAINGNGAHGAWSEWKMTREEDCLALGVTCVVKR